MCYDYDLCEACEAKGAAVHDLSHPLIKIGTPSFNRHRRGGGGGRCGRWARWQGASTNARFVQHVTLNQSGSVVAPGQKFVKIWRMRNEGTAAWSEHTALAFVGGDPLGAPAVVLVGTVAPGAEMDISVDMVAPSAPGRYVSYWRLCGPDGASFGHRLWVEVVVQGNSVATNEVIAPPSSDPVPEPTSEPVPEQAQDPFSFFFQPIPFAPAPLVPEPAPAPVAVPVPVPVPEPAPAPVSVPAPAPVPEPAPASVAEPVVQMSPVEEELVNKLKEMGFGGDLLTVLRNNGGEFFSALQALLNN